MTSDWTGGLWRVCALRSLSFRLASLFAWDIRFSLSRLRRVPTCTSRAHVLQLIAGIKKAGHDVVRTVS
eukprot:1117564-Prymnesium_polylepis.1